MPHVTKPLTTASSPPTTETDAGRVLARILDHLRDPEAVDLLTRYAAVMDLVEAQEGLAFQAVDLHQQLTSSDGEIDDACSLRLDLEARLACAAALGGWR